MAQNERIIKNFEQFNKALDSLAESTQQELKDTVKKDLALKKAVRAEIINCLKCTFERNLTVHTYNEDTTQEVRDFIINEAVKIFINLKVLRSKWS